MREVPLPRDHEGREIPLDTEVMYDWRGTKVSVKKFLSRTMLNRNYSVITNMSLCHAAYFCKGWENARGCRIEHDAAVAYGLEVLYED